MALLLTWLRKLESRRQSIRPARRVPWSFHLCTLERLEDRLAPATDITVIVGATGTGSLDTFLSATDGTLATSDNPGVAGTLSSGALAAVNSTTDISINAETSITFNDLTTGLSLQTGASHSATFTAGIGAITFANTTNTLSTAGGGLNFSAGTSATVAKLATNGGDISLTAVNDISAGAISAPGHTVTITSSAGAILDGNDPPTGTVNITALNLALSASTGIGIVSGTLTAADALIETQVSNLEAQTATGGIFIHNGVTAPITLTVSGVTNTLNGLHVTGATGDIQPTNEGSIALTDPGHTGDNLAGPADISVTANGAAADVQTGGGSHVYPDGAIVASGGTVTVTAGRDILIGNPAEDLNHSFGNVVGGGSVVLSAGRHVILDGGGAVATQGTGTATVTAGTAGGAGDVSLFDTNGSFGSSGIFTEGGDITITTAPGGTFTNDAGKNQFVGGVFTGGNPAVASATGGNVTISADDMVINSPISAAGTTSSGIVTLQQAGTTTRAIDLGTDTAGKLGLTAAEINQVTASILRIGRSDNAGDITVSALIKPTGTGTLHLITGGAILDGNDAGPAPADLDIEVDSLALEAVNGIATNATLNVHLDTGFAAPVGTLFRIIDNDSGDATTGTFANLANLANNAVFTIGGTKFQINYNGGDGNDVTLTVVAPLTAAGSPAKSAKTGPLLTDAALAPIVHEAVAEWIHADLKAAAVLAHLSVHTANLPGKTLGLQTGPHSIVIDRDAAGFGWFVDPTPAGNTEFAASAGRLLARHGSTAAGHMDLLTVVRHEIGHVLGHDDLPGVHGNDLMGELLQAGVRKEVIDAAFGGRL